jgi:hypothetical protein
MIPQQICLLLLNTAVSSGHEAAIFCPRPPEGGEEVLVSYLSIVLLYGFRLLEFLFYLRLLILLRLPECQAFTIHH